MSDMTELRFEARISDFRSREERVSDQNGTSKSKICQATGSELRYGFQHTTYTSHRLGLES